MNLTLQLHELPVRMRFDVALTDDELERFCTDNDPLRVERDSNGELILMSPNFPGGGSIEFELGVEFGIWARENGKGKGFGASSGFTLPDTSMRAADAAWVSWDRWNALTEAEKKSYSPLCPEFVIELRSQSDRLKPLQDKMRMWVANGAKLAWLIDPERRVVEVYRAGEETEVYENPSSVQGSGPVAGFELVLSRIWG